MDKIATIIDHYNTKTDTDNTLKSLAKIDAGKFEHAVFVVDNGSKDNYRLPKGAPPATSLIRSSTNLGFTGGNNLGFQKAITEFNPDFFLLLNSDTLVEPNFLNLLYAELKNKPRTALVSPLIYFAPNYEYHTDSYARAERGSVIWYAGGVIDWPNLGSFHIGVDEVDRDQFLNYPPKSDFASGCCFLIRREVCEAIGGFDDRFFLYYEDADLCYRVRKAGYELSFCPEAKIWHVSGASGGGGGSPLQRYYLTRNRLLFYWRYGSLKIKITTLRLAWRFLLGKEKTERLAASHFFTNHYGKQVYI